MSRLTAVALRVAYADRVALDDVGLDLAAGDFLAVTGPSGCGKTTLLWVLAGALAPTSGGVRLDQTDVTSREQAAAAGIVLLPQGNALATSLTATENVVVPLLVAGVGSADAASRAEEAMERVGMEESGTHLVEELSGGQQQRIAVARAIASRADVLLADEPTSDLDAGNRQRVVDALRAEAARGAVVVMSTNDPLAAEQADSELALLDGRVVPADRPPTRHRR